MAYFQFHRPLVLLLALLAPSIAKGQVTEIISRDSYAEDAFIRPDFQSVVADGDGNAYFTARDSDHVFKVDPAGEVTVVMDATGDGMGHTMDGPMGVTLDANGNLYVNAALSGNVFRVTPEGQITEIAKNGVNGTRLIEGTGIAVDGEGNVFAVAHSSHNALRIEDPTSCSTSGNPCVITELLTESGFGGHGYRYPRGVTTDQYGNMYTAGAASSKVFKVAPSGDIEMIADLSDPYCALYGMVVDSADNLFVACHLRNSVLKITPEGEQSVVIDASGAGPGMELEAPIGLVLDILGNLYVTGSVSHNIFQVTPSGEIAEIMRSDSAGPNSLLGTPWAVAVNPLGDVFTTGLYSNNAFKIELGPLVFDKEITVSVLNGDSLPDGSEASPDTGTDFGSAPGTSSFQITNTGDSETEPLTVTGITVSGDDAEDFVIGGISFPPNLVLGQNESATFTVTFDPSDAGIRGAVVEIASDAGNASPFTFEVRGVGVADFGDAGDLAEGQDYTASTKLMTDGARHLAAGPILGTYRDTEADGLADGSAHGDDHTPASPDDEDGVVFPFNEEVGVPAMATKSSTITPMAGVLISESSVGLTVTLSGPTTGYLNAWLDWSDGDTDGPDGSFDDGGEHIIPNHQLSAGTNTVPVVLPEFVGETTAVMRFRVTEASVAVPNPIGLETTGEVEDHLVSLKTGPQPIAPQGLGSGSVGLEGGNLVIRNAAGDVVSSVPIGSVSSLTITGDASDETVTLDWDLVAAIPSITLNLGDGFDALVIDQGTGSPSTIVYNHTDATSGTITDGTNTVMFTGLDPIIDNGLTATRVFTFTADNETIVLSADGDGFTDNGMSYIDGGAAEEVSFVNPTSTLEVNTANGTNTVLVGLLDTDVDASFLGVTVNGGTGSDTFTVTPASYPITIDGSTEPGTCPGDGLVLDLSGGAVVDVFTYDSGAGDGSYTFSSGHADVTFTDIESVGATELSIAANLATIYATQDLTTAAGNELIVTVSNDGDMDANCVTVELSQALAAFLDGEVGDESTGTLAGTTWTIPTLEAGEEATLTITGLVINVNEGALTFTVDALQDTDDSNNTALVAMSFGFQMPAKAHVNSALYYNKSTTGGAYDALIVGLYQGSPGIDGAVWCKVPEGVGSWPTIPAASIGNLFRPCSTGLPFPLHVNDIFEDANETLWLTTWGNAGLYRSDDDGESWTDVEPILGPKSGWANVYTIIEDDLDGTLYISANNGLVFRSLNDGDTWQQVGSLPGVSADTPWSMAAHPSVSGTVYAGTFGNGVFVSEDFGFTWDELDDPTTVPNENDDLLDSDASGDDFAGHIFDLEFSPDAGGGGEHVLFAGTGKGVWRAELASGTSSTFPGGWEQIGPMVTLDDLTVVTPEVRTLAFAPDPSPSDDDLVAGTWGFGAFLWDDPNGAATYEEIALKGSEVTFVAINPSGGILVGSSTGVTTLVTASSSTSTATEPAEAAELPEGYALGQNYPNPFNPVTTIGFSVPETGRVKLSVFDGLGREVAVLVDGTIEAGNHEARFDAKSLPTGAYLYRLSTDAGAIARTLILMK